MTYVIHYDAKDGLQFILQRNRFAIAKYSCYCYIHKYSLRSVVFKVHSAKKDNVGFTIVELLIVIVVIGILAVIIIVVYNGIRHRAADVALQTDLRNIGSLVDQYFVFNGSYPTTSSNEISAFKLKVSKGVYDVSGNNLYYCTIASGPGAKYSVSARSISGKVFAYYDGLIQNFTGSFTTNTPVCSGAGGISSSDPDYYFSNGHIYTGTWRSWTE